MLLLACLSACRLYVFVVVVFAYACTLCLHASVVFLIVGVVAKWPFYVGRLVVFVIGLRVWSAGLPFRAPLRQKCRALLTLALLLLAAVALPDVLANSCCAACGCSL